jgi:hypothetical protein
MGAKTLFRAKLFPIKHNQAAIKTVAEQSLMA